MSEIITKEIISEKSFEIIIEVLSKKVHDQWMAGRISEGWKYGKELDGGKKEHPSIIPYEELPESEKEYDRQTVLATLTGLLENGYEIIKNEFSGYVSRSSGNVPKRIEQPFTLV